MENNAQFPITIESHDCSIPFKVPDVKMKGTKRIKMEEDNSEEESEISDEEKTDTIISEGLTILNSNPLLSSGILEIMFVNAPSPVLIQYKDLGITINFKRLKKENPKYTSLTKYITEKII